MKRFFDEAVKFKGELPPPRKIAAVVTSCAPRRIVGWRDDLDADRFLADAEIVRLPNKGGSHG